MAYESPPSGPDYYSQFPEGFPEAGLFNLQAMSDEQIVMLGRALDSEHERMCEDDTNTPAHVVTTAGLLEHLGSDLAQLVVADPERGKALLMRLAQSDDAYERRIALTASIPLCRLDYESACNLFLAAQDKIREAPDGDDEDVAGPLGLMARLLPTDLADDLFQRAYERWP